MQGHSMLAQSQYQHHDTSSAIAKTCECLVQQQELGEGFSPVSALWQRATSRTTVRCTCFGGHAFAQACKCRVRNTQNTRGIMGSR